MRAPARHLGLAVSAFALSACLAGQAPQPRAVQPGLGQYVRPAFLNPVPTPRVPDTDACRSQFYRSLVGMHEGAIYIAGLPGDKRVLKPAFDESFDTDFPGLPEDANPFVEVRDYLPEQSLYAPSIRTVSDLALLGDFRTDRLTLTLDADGYIQEVGCG